MDLSRTVREVSSDNSNECISARLEHIAYFADRGPKLCHSANGSIPAIGSALGVYAYLEAATAADSINLEELRNRVTYMD